MIRTFNSLDEMFAHLAENNRRAEDMTTDEQWALGPGDFFLHKNQSNFLVLGCVVGSSDAEDREQENQPRCLTQLSRIFSPFLPNGELESTLRCNMHPITREQFQHGLEHLGINPKFPVFLRDGTEITDWRSM